MQLILFYLFLTTINTSCLIVSHSFHWEKLCVCQLNLEFKKSEWNQGHVIFQAKGNNKTSGAVTGVMSIKPFTPTISPSPLLLLSYFTFIFVCLYFFP